MIEIRLDGYSGRIGGLVQFEPTATGILVRLLPPLSTAIEAGFQKSDRK
jgi:hypothetical protein